MDGERLGGMDLGGFANSFIRPGNYCALIKILLTVQADEFSFNVISVNHDAMNSHLPNKK